MATIVQKLFKNHLFATNVTVSISLSALGDYLQQKYEHKNRAPHLYQMKTNALPSSSTQASLHPRYSKIASESQAKFTKNFDLIFSGAVWNLRRTGQMSISFGMTSGFLCHFWYNYLDKILPGKSLKIVTRKILYDQILFSPVCILSCLVVASIIDQHSSERAYKEILSKGEIKRFF